MEEHSREEEQQTQKAKRVLISAQVESKAEAPSQGLGKHTTDLGCSPVKGKITEGFRQKSVWVFLGLCLPLVRMFCFLCNWHNPFGKQFGII